MKGLRVREVMTHLVVALGPDESVHQAAQRLAGNNISGAPVVEDGRVIGMISEADLLHAVAPHHGGARGASVLDFLEHIGGARPSRRGHGIRVEEVMSPFVVEIGPDASIWEASRLMERKGLKRLPVVDTEDRLIGIVSRADLIRAIARDDAQLERDVKAAVLVLGEDVFTSFQVEVVDGIATLSGCADRRSTHELALKLAESVPGVFDVVDHLDFAFDDSTPAALYQPKDPRLDWNPDLLGARQR